jgi:hypothetical protein
VTRFSHQSGRHNQSIKTPDKSLENLGCSVHEEIKEHIKFRKCLLQIKAGSHAFPSIHKDTIKIHITIILSAISCGFEMSPLALKK